MCKFVRGHYELHYVILNLDKCFRRRRRLKIFVIFSSGGPFVPWNETIRANLVKDIMRNFL